MPVCVCRACRGWGGGHVESHHGVVPGPAGAAGWLLVSVGITSGGGQWSLALLWVFSCAPALPRHPAQVSRTGRVGLLSLWLRISPAVGHAWSGEEPQGP